jgi:4-hydroxybenzoate polyprenyltransferase
MLDLVPPTSSQAGLVPLVVDLDGTLIRSDLFIESLFAELGRRPAAVAALLPTLFAGWAAFKYRFADFADVDVSRLPYDESVLAAIKAARADGRRVYLASASSEKLVAEIARHLGLFDGWIGSNAEVHLTDGARADLLVEAFGAGQFDYVGNAAADLAVWQKARRSITIRAPASVRRKLPTLCDDVEYLDSVDANPVAWIGLLRIHQWVKNTLVFVPMLLAHQFTIGTLGHAVLAFVAFSLCASGAYVLNDLVDLGADRMHPTKRMRAFASGAVPLAAGLVIVPVLWIAAFAAAALTTIPFVLTLFAYLVLTTLYSLGLKRLMLIDAFALAGLYTIRVIGGGTAAAVAVSHWLLAFSMFMFIGLALIKRYVELAALADKNLPNPANRNYQIGDLNIVAALSAAAGYNAVVVLALYLNSDAVVPLYHRPDLLWFVCPIVLFWFSRVLLLAHRRSVHDDPIVFALKDRVSLMSAGLAVALVLAAM